MLVPGVTIRSGRTIAPMIAAANNVTPTAPATH